jgi:hypothetical protein
MLTLTNAVCMLYVSNKDTSPAFRFLLARSSIETRLHHCCCRCRCRHAQSPLIAAAPLSPQWWSVPVPCVVRISINSRHQLSSAAATPSKRKMVSPCNSQLLLSPLTNELDRRRHHLSNISNISSPSSMLSDASMIERCFDYSCQLSLFRPLALCQGRCLDRLCPTVCFAPHCH